MSWGGGLFISTFIFSSHLFSSVIVFSKHCVRSYHMQTGSRFQYYLK